MENTVDGRRTSRHKQRAVSIAIVAGILLIAGITIFLLHGGFTDPHDPKVIIGKLEQHILLPSEEPNITTIDNAASVSDQPFFKDVADGDKLIVYSASARIIIYRPTTDIIINVGPIIDDAALNTPPAE